MLRILSLVFDPRGRCSRKGLLILMLVTLLLQCGLGVLVFGMGVSFTGSIALVIKAVFVWVAISASIQRLHDIGKSGWLFLAAMVFVFVWLALWSGIIPLYIAMNFGIEHVELFSPMFYLFAVTSYMPVLVGALWLHFRKGDAGPNRFGPAPDAGGFARRAPREMAQTQPQTAVAA